MPRRRAESACARCGNELDLDDWDDGKMYCRPCLQCPHGRDARIGCCLQCLRNLHSVATFEGPRILDVVYYVTEAHREYGAGLWQLITWTFEEAEELADLAPRLTEIMRHEPGLRLPPLHHRF